MRYGLGQDRVRKRMDPDTRRLALFAGGLGAVLLTLIGASFLVDRRSAGELPVVAADSRPIRVKPADPGGMKVDGAENEAFATTTDNKNPKLAAAAEMPDTRRLVAVPEVKRSMPPVPSQDTEPAAPAQAAAPIPVKPPAVAVAPPVPARPVPAKPLPEKLAAAAEARPRPASGHPAAEPRPVAAPHIATVQLAALASEEAARAEWQQLSKRMPDLLNGHQPAYSQTERNGHVFWRLRTAGFADAGQAKAFCEQVRAKGGRCSVADF